MKKWNLDAERELLADACVPGRHEHSLWNFVRFAAGWHYRCLEPEQVYWLSETVHKPWLDWAEGIILAWKMRRRSKASPERVQVVDCVPRGHGKSNLLTKCLPIYTMLDEPNISWYIGSETHPKAKKFLAPIKSILDGSDPFARFAWLYGNWCSPERDWNQEEIITAYRTSIGTSEPSIGTFGVETGITSKHPLGLIYDDPISEEKLREGGNWLALAIKSLDSIYPALRPDSLIWLIGTRYLDRDPIGYSLESEGVRDWFGHPPLETYKPGAWHVHFLQARDRLNTTNYPEGEPILPELFTHDSLLRYENKNPQEYAAQMMNDPSTGEHMEMTKDQIEKMRIERKDVPAIEYATIHLDTAFKDDERRGKGDYNAIVVWLHDLRPTGIVYLDRVLRSKNWRMEDFHTHLIRIMYDLKRRGIRIRAITDEKEMGGKRGVYLQHLQQAISGAGLRMVEILQFNRAGTKKVLRIREAAGYWVDGFVRLPRDTEGMDALILEMLKIGRSPNDDCADAAADVFRPEVWRGRSSTGTDGQPILPTQPGDDVLKGRVEQELQEMIENIQQGKRRWETERDEDQPYERMLAERNEGQSWQ